MPIDYEKVMNFPIPAVENTYTERDTMLYALAVGLGADPLDPRELAFVLEDHAGTGTRRLRVLPTMSTVLAWDDRWMYETGIDMTKQVHGEQRIRIHRPLPAAATVVARTRVVDVFDKGPGKGMIMVFETEISDKATGAVLATNVATSFARGEGGFGGPAGSPPAPHAIPGRPPDAVFAQKTLATQALLYRLCGDRNPLHADPAYAARGGFDRPILHGLCTLGHAGAAVVRAGCDYDPDVIEELAVRFTRPVFPGETIRTEVWKDGRVVSFRSHVAERDVVVLDHGMVRLHA
ncbi:MAG: MaoC family dehydratase N-terminal domain-containing protein [Candidatus Rokubacteria bacterium]|nr:MaoC family dehydratase N-terminal domain-containing protein [Candidatus Rokubacteria bacterium]